MADHFARSKQDWLLFVGLICFFFSGAAGLIYQVVWTRMLTQIFGNTTYAIATVLSAFMAGLALGSYLFGRIADRGSNDFFLYGILEAGVGVYGFLVPWLFGLGQRIYVPLFGLNETFPFLFNFLLFSLSFVLLLLPTMLMGATLPVLSRFFVRSFVHLGRRVGDLYATNTLGAVLGCGFAGYILIPNSGMRAAVYVAASINLSVALMILIADRVRDKEGRQLPPETDAAVRTESTARAVPSWLGSALLGSFALSGFAALLYENAWTRALTLVIGSSVYSFTTMLTTFLVGLALGGFLYARSMGEREIRISTFGLVELWVGLTALATIPLFEKLPLIFLRLLQGFGDSFPIFLSIQVLLSALVMILPTVLLGMTFPMVARLFTQDLYRVGSSVGNSYAANTVGAILGAFAGGFILIPRIGVQNTILAGVVVNLLVGWVLVVADPRLSRLWRFALGIVVLILVIQIPFKVPGWDRYVLTSGVTIYNDRFESLPVDSLRLEEMRRDEIIFYREGLTATVSVQRILGTDYIYFRTNGKIDGSYGDALSQLMVGYIPLFLHPQAEVAAVIGLGTGMSAKALGSSPVMKNIEVMEIEPAMVQASKLFDLVSVNLAELPAGVDLSPDRARRIRYDTAEKMLVYKGVMTEDEREKLMNLSGDRRYQLAIAGLYRKALNSRHGSILEDERVRLIPTDGRNYILATPKSYDIITAEPSNPWIAGIANLYTREFYEVVKSKLKEEGIFAQWFHNYSMSPDDFRMVFRTFGEAFPHVSLWGMKESDFLLVGSKREQVFDYAALKEIFDKNPVIQSDLDYLRLSDIYAVQGFYRMGREGILAFSKGADINTDDGAELEFSAPKNIRRPTTELNRQLMAPYLSDAPWLRSRPLAVPAAMHHFYLAQSYAGSLWNARALEELNQAIRLEPRNAEFHLLNAKILLDQEKSAEAARAVLLALEIDPHSIPRVLDLSDDFFLTEARAIYSKTIEMGSRNVVPYLGLGNIALHGRDLKEAEKWYERAKNINPDHPSVLLAEGRLFLAKGELEKAREFLERSKEAGEESSSLASSLAEVYTRLKIWEKAADAYAFALKFSRRNVNWRRGLGIALAKLGRIGEAETKFREVLAFNPNDAEAWKELEKLGKRY